LFVQTDDLDFDPKAASNEKKPKAWRGEDENSFNALTTVGAGPGPGMVVRPPESETVTASSNAGPGKFCSAQSFSVQALRSCRQAP
jgi:hypothetical protein